jgi:hypothetical protein
MMDWIEEVIMSQCHDIYSWHDYRGANRDAPQGTQCHDPDESEARNDSPKAVQPMEKAHGPSTVGTLQPA